MPIGFNPTGDSSNKGVKPSKKNPAKQAPEEEKTSGPVDNAMDDDSDFDIQPKKQNKKLIYIGIALVAALIIGIVYYTTTSDNTPTIENTTESMTSDVQDDLSSDEDDEEGFIYDENGNPYNETDSTSDEITTYATALKKTDGTNKLAGAKFAFYGLTVEKTADGVYTVVSYDATAYNTTEGATQDPSKLGTEMEVDADGKLYIVGLGENVTLKGVETVAPNGYNKLTTEVTLTP